MSVASPQAVVLLQMGGPTTLDDLPSFYTRLFEDRDIIQLPPLLAAVQPQLARAIAWARSGSMRKRYQQIGGGSPLLGHTAGIAAALESELVARGRAALVRLAMRYSEPSAEPVLAELGQRGVREITLLPLYPHWSHSTTGSSVRDVIRAARGTGFEGEVCLVCAWGEAPPYVDLLAAYIQRERDALAQEWDGPIHLLFSAHGLPVRYVTRGDAYPREVEATVCLLGERVSGFAGQHLSFQSRMGPVQWLQPSTDLMLRRLAADGVQALVAVPLGFVSDHIETLYDLDILYRQEARELGILRYRRVPSFNADPAFARVLADVLENAKAVPVAL